MKKVKIEIPEMNESWEDFPWDSYPAGVHVTFVLVAGGTGSVLLVKPQRFSYDMPCVEMSKDGTLQTAYEAFEEKLSKLGVSFQSCRLSKLGAVEDGEILHVIFRAEVSGLAGAVEAVSPDKSYQVESGLAVSNRASRVVPFLLGWNLARWPSEEPVAT